MRFKYSFFSEYTFVNDPSTPKHHLQKTSLDKQTNFAANLSAFRKPILSAPVIKTAVSVETLGWN